MNAEEFEKFDGLIFDCDGTLADSMPIHYLAWRDTLARHGIDFPEDRFYSMGGMSSEKIVRALATEQGVVVEPSVVAEQKETLFQKSLSDVRPKQDVCDLAREYHRRKPMAVASGSGRVVVLKQLVNLEIDHLFDAIVTSEDTERHKPEPDVFLEAARRIGVEPTGCVVFEDSPLGFQAAEAAGMHWVDVR
ncbi:MAG: HAD-IA family hydrolase [Planctomycetota bacterium]